MAEPEPSPADRALQRAALESLWQRKLNQVVALSTACAEDDRRANPAVLPLPRLRDRATRAIEDLAGIEDAIARVDNGSYGLCAGCGERMPEEWLAEEQHVRHCPDCALRLVEWKSSRPATVTLPLAA